MVILYVIESHIILQLGSDSVLFSCFSSRAALDPVHPIYTVCYHPNFIHIEKKTGLFVPGPKIKCEESLNKGITLDVFMNLYSIVFDNIKGVTNARNIFLSRLLSYKGIFRIPVNFHLIFNPILFAMFGGDLFSDSKFLMNKAKY